MFRNQDSDLRKVCTKILCKVQGATEGQVIQPHPSLLWPVASGRKQLIRPLLAFWSFAGFVHTATRGIYGRKSADRTEPHFGVIFFVFLSTFFGNLEVCDVKTCNIFWKYMSATCRKHFGWTCGPILKYHNFDRFYPQSAVFGIFWGRITGFL